MARKRIYREPKQQMGVSIHSDLADMTAALAKEIQPTHVVTEILSEEVARRRPPVNL